MLWRLWAHINQAVSIEGGLLTQVEMHAIYTIYNYGETLTYIPDLEIKQNNYSKTDRH